MRDDWIEQLAARLAPIPAAPPLPAQLRAAAVLAMIYPRDAQLYIPLIERARSGGVHSGQLALPGGRYEPHDQNLLTTALREAQEEVGVDPDTLTPLGWLPPVEVRVSGFVAVPYVAWTPRTPTLSPNDAEVASIVELPVTVLLDPTSVREVPNPPGSQHPVMFEYILPEGRLWGATARMMHNLALIMPPLLRDN